MSTLGVAIIGSGGIALANHLPGLALCPDVKVVAVCDNDPGTLERAKAVTGVSVGSTDWQEIIKRDDVHAVIICTPNHVHGPISIATAKLGKHILCEKPISMSTAEAHTMWKTAEAHKVRHMTAFTYRFVPAMRYMAHLVKQGAVGTPYHFRVHRFQDWGVRPLGWRQLKQFAATGEMGDMLSHRIDYGHMLVGPIARLVAQTKLLVKERGGKPADVEDWVAVLADFKQGATGVMESSKLATGCGEGKDSPDRCEVNGSEGTVVYQLANPNQILRASKDDKGLKAEQVPSEFLVFPGSPRDPAQGDPGVVFRYDQNIEFIRAIREGRSCAPSFAEGCAAQAVMDAALTSTAERRWVDVVYPTV
ncbi:MAG: Gfo/Idh/MocA family oxidoreductase [Planctomycetes bacterium]|nr:Gfo/Idh/MocA family oxidoreductase [Planctomycetota bacterium]